jgi:predicted nuclease with TOPRIM domain
MNLQEILANLSRKYDQVQDENRRLYTEINRLQSETVRMREENKRFRAENARLREALKIGAREEDLLAAIRSVLFALQSEVYTPQDARTYAINRLQYAIDQFYQAEEDTEPNMAGEGNCSSA